MERLVASCTKLSLITLLSDLTPISVNYTMATYFHPPSLFIFIPFFPLTFLFQFFPFIFLILSLLSPQ